MNHILASAITIPLAGGLAISGSRLSWLIFLLLLALHIKGKKNATPAILLASIFLGVQLGKPAQMEVQRVQADMMTISKPVDANNPRLILAEHASLMLKEHPLTGIGWGQFAYGVYSQQDKITSPVTDRHAHNIFYQMAAELGWPGLLLTVAIFALIAWSASWNALTFGVLGIMGLHSLVEFPLWYAMLLGPSAVLLGVALCKKH